MNDDTKETNDEAVEFDISTYPRNSLFHERRTGGERRRNVTQDAKTQRPSTAPAKTERRVKKERRRRIDPTTFEKQYTDDEMEFMNAIQRFKELSGKAFPSHGEVIKVAVELGYRKLVADLDQPDVSSETESPASAHHASVDVHHSVGALGPRVD